jgi:chemotaxis protein CheY-P-specific phosphatase CheC
VSDAADRQRERAARAVLDAADALAALLDVTAGAEPAGERRLEPGEVATEGALQASWPASIFADLSGAVTGEIAVQLDRETQAELFEHLLGELPKSVAPERAHAALYEAGNILISAAAGAFARQTGAVVLPSVPRVVRSGDDAPRDPLPRSRDPRRAWLSEATLRHGGRPLRLRLIWIPDNR